MDQNKTCSKQAIRDSACFNSLPIFVQENIEQCGCPFSNEAELEAFAQHLLGENQK